MTCSRWSLSFVSSVLATFLSGCGSNRRPSEVHALHAGTREIGLPRVPISEEAPRGIVGITETVHSPLEAGDGKELRIEGFQKVRHLPGTPVCLAWNPHDHRLYAALIDMQHEPPVSLGLWSLDKSGENLRRTKYEGVLGIAGSSVAWSPNGVELATLSNSHVSWGPDGKLLRGGSIAIASSSTGATRIIGRQAPYHCRELAWSHDGKRLVYEAVPVSGHAGGGGGMALAIWVINADGTGERQIVERGYRPRWLPDGESISYYDPVDAGWWLVRLDGTDKHAVPLPNNPGAGEIVGTEIEWSPDGKHLAYPKSRSQLKGRTWELTESGLAVLDLDTHSEQLLVRIGDLIENVRWSPDGQRIAFCASDEPKRIRSIPVADYIGIVTLREAQSKETKSEKKGRRQPQSRVGIGGGTEVISVKPDTKGGD